MLASCLAMSGCGFAWRVLQRNLSAPPERAVAHRVREPRRPEARLAALWVGHATVLLQMDDRFVLTDPLFSHTLAQASRRLVEPGFDAANLPPLAAVVVSHMHFDHLSFGSLDLLEVRTPVVLVPPGVRASMPRYSFEIRELSRWQSYEKDGLRVSAVPVQHVGGRYGIDAAFETRAFTGYVFEYHGISVYFGGDTAYKRDYATLRTPRNSLVCERPTLKTRMNRAMDAGKQAARRGKTLLESGRTKVLPAPRTNKPGQ